MLTWSSIGVDLEDAILHSGRRLRLVICPFIQLPALRRLLDPMGSVDDLQVITRWNAADLVSGVSDIEVLPYLTGRGAPLYVHRNIHVKLYIFNDGSAFLGSGNLTQAGLGWGKQANIEAGSFVQLDEEDWKHVNSILRQSARLDEAAYSLAAAFIKDHRVDHSPLPTFDLPSAPTGGFSLLDLPAANSPTALVESIKAAAAESSRKPQVIHDMQLLGVNLETLEDQMVASVLRGYRELQAVCAVVRWLSESGSRSFGEVTQWLHANLTDRPMPYRSDVKEAVANLYRWLPVAFNQISVGRPHHSEVLYFKQSD
jgi:hypothetical protein